MSRNLTCSSCCECPGGHEHIVLEEEPRPASREDIGDHFFDSGEYTGLLVAKAHCVLCHTLYLAWVDWAGGHDYWDLASKSRDSAAIVKQRFCDLSYRHAFNDEPSPVDVPLYTVTAKIVYSREPMKAGEHTYQRRCAPEELMTWKKRAAAEFREGRTIVDDLDKAGLAAEK